MTTGRINQVTIVRRGWPPPPRGGGELVTAYTTGVVGVPAVEARPVAPGDAFRFSPLRFPGRWSATHARTCAGGGACRSQEETFAPQLLQGSCRVGISRCLVVGLANGQQSTEPNQRRSRRKKRLSAPGHPGRGAGAPQGGR